jgi:hypothetical protein
MNVEDGWRLGREGRKKEVMLYMTNDELKCAVAAQHVNFST